MEITKKPRKVETHQRRHGGDAPIDPNAVQPTDRLHRRVESAITSAIRMGCERIVASHCPPGARSTVIATQLLEVDDDDDDRATPRSIVDAIVCALQDEASAYPIGESQSFSLVGVREDGTEITSERVRLMGTRKVPPRERTDGEIIADEETALADRSGLGVTQSRDAMHPREVASLSGIVRQQMRHNEALVASVVRLSTGTADSQAKIIDQQSGRILSLTEKLEKQADAYVDTARKQRILEAEARSEEAKGKAIEVTGEVLKEFLPAALHRISRKYGLAGDADVDPLIEKIMESFEEEQLDKLTQILKPAQKAYFAEAWMLVNDRRAKKEAEAEKKKKAEAKTLPEGGHG